jgi:hypothetical protein
VVGNVDGEGGYMYCLLELGRGGVARGAQRHGATPEEKEWSLITGRCRARYL